MNMCYNNKKGNRIPQGAVATKRLTYIITLRDGQGDYFFIFNNTFTIDIIKEISDNRNIKNIIIRDNASYVLISHHLLPL